MRTNDKTLLIHAKTESEARRVCRIFHKDLKLKWSDGSSFKKFTEWHHYKENTVYGPYLGKFYNMEWVEKNGYKVVDSECIKANSVFYHVWDYISRPWVQDDYVHPLLRIVPPFVFEVLAYLILIAIVASYCCSFDIISFLFGLVS